MAVTQSTQPSSPAALWGTLLVLASAFLFALKAIVIKSAFAAVPAFDGVTLLALRMLTALPFYLLLVWHSPPPGAVAHSLLCRPGKISPAGCWLF